MTEADNHSFEENKRLGLIYRENGDYHPVVTKVKCVNCGYVGDADEMIEDGVFFLCSEECKKEFNNG